MARKKHRVPLKPVLFIACEGTSSEYHYFESWAQSNNVLEQFERVDIYPDENEDNPKTTPYQLFQKAKNALDDGSADLAWVVFDKDMHPHLPKTFKEAAAADVRIAFSARSIEEWVLLHFERNMTSFLVTECSTKAPKKKSKKPINCGTLTVPNCLSNICLAGHLRRQNYINDYSKKRDFDLYSKIFEKTEIALVNAAWLRYKVNASINRKQSNLHSINPYSDVDQLILKLNGRSDKIEWGKCNSNITLNDWTINVNIRNIHIVLLLSHTRNTPEVINAEFHISSFFTTNEELIIQNCIFSNKRLISNHNGSSLELLQANDVIEYTFNQNRQPFFLFVADNRLTRIFVELQ